MFFQFGSNVIQGIRFLSEGNGSFLDIRAGNVDFHHRYVRVRQALYDFQIILDRFAADIDDDLCIKLL